MSTEQAKQRGINKQLWAIHSWIGLYAGVVIATLSLTGVVALFKVEIDRALNSHLYTVAAVGETVAVSPQIESLRQKYGAENLLQVHPPRRATDSWRAMFLLVDGIDVRQLEVFIDPYSGEVIGERDYTRSLAYFIRQIHVRLYESAFGRQIVGIAGIALLISTLTGFLIYGRFMRKQLFAAIREGKLRVWMADYHKLIGVLTLAFNLMIAITGAWLGLQAYLQPVIVGDRPGFYRPAELPMSEADDLERFVDFEQVQQASRNLFPELVPYLIQPSRDGGNYIRIAGDVPGSAYERHTFSLTLNKRDLTEVHRLDTRVAGPGTKLFYLQESLHFGDYGGIVLKIVYTILGLTSGFLSLAGFVVYLERTEKKRREKPRFVALKPLLLRWSYGIIGACVVLAILQLNFGPVIPAILVAVAFYGSLLFILLRALGRFAWTRLTTARTS